MKKTTLVATTFTVMLVTFFVVLLYIRRGELSGLELNEIGDFLAGFAAPLAFIWLIAGYVQQGLELEQNTAALKSQQQELKEQVEATKVLASQADRQAKAIEESTLFAQAEARKNAELRAILRQPRFEIVKQSVANSLYSFHLYNHGADVSNVEVIYAGHCIASLIHFDKNNKIFFQLQGPFHNNLEIIIAYVDNEGKHGRQMFSGTTEKLDRISIAYDFPN